MADAAMESPGSERAAAEDRPQGGDVLRAPPRPPSIAPSPRSTPATIFDGNTLQQVVSNRSEGLGGVHHGAQFLFKLLG